MQHFLFSAQSRFVGYSTFFYWLSLKYDSQKANFRNTALFSKNHTFFNELQFSQFWKLIQEMVRISVFLLNGQFSHMKHKNTRYYILCFLWPSNNCMCSLNMNMNMDSKKSKCVLQPWKFHSTCTAKQCKSIDYCCMYGIQKIKSYKFMLWILCYKYHWTDVHWWIKIDVNIWHSIVFGSSKNVTKWDTFSEHKKI